MSIPLMNMKHYNVAEIKFVSLRQDFLQREFGVKTGDMLWSYARGIDTREVQQAQVLYPCPFL